MKSSTAKPAFESERKLPLHGVDQVALFGAHDVNLKVIEKEFSARMIARGSQLILRGEQGELDQVERVVTELVKSLERNGEITENDVQTIVALVKSDGKDERASSVRPPAIAGSEEYPIILFAGKGPVRPRSPGQRHYVELVAKNDIVFSIGPAGTGKTYLAVATSVAYLQAKEVDRIILARPAVEAGESLGFLPGDLREKVDPYLRPLYDALHDMLPPDRLRKYLERGIIEIVPLAYMRGRTLNHAFVILDEAQNSTALQMKMFLTRLGIGSKAIVTGDVTQIDLSSTHESGLVQIQRIVKGIEGIEFAYLSEQDVVRHRLVRDIIRAYDEFNASGNSSVRK